MKHSRKPRDDRLATVHNANHTITPQSVEKRTEVFHCFLNKGRFTIAVSLPR
jgi:hypothetical protein